MKKRLSKYSIFILCAAVILLCVLIFAREEPLSVKLNTNNIESDVSVVLIRQYTETEYNGDVYRRHIVYTIEDGIESEAVQELLDTLDSIPARQRVFFPFERISVYRTGYDTLSIMFEANGERIDASMMKDFSTLYDSGTSPYKAYVVGIESFEKIASVIEKYGEVESK